MGEAADVVIVGGGVIGASVAFHLARRGGKAILIEKNRLATGETSLSPGLVMHQTGMSELSRLAKFSIEEYAGLPERYGVDVGFHRLGSILYSTQHKDELSIYLKVQTDLGIPTRILSSAEISSMVPFVNTSDIKAGVYCSLDGYVDPSSLALFYAGEAQKSGVDIREHVELRGIRTTQGRVTGIETSEGFLKATTIVNATGALAHRVGNYLGVDFPVRNETRNIVVVGPSPFGAFPILEHVESEWYFRPFNDNGVLAGVGYTISAEKEPSDLHPPAAYNLALAASNFFTHRVPEIASSHIISEWCGIRSLTTTGVPVIGSIEGIEGFLNCCGWSGFGITCAGAAGELMADLILSGDTKLVELEPFLFSNHEPEPLQWKRRDGDLLLGDQTLSEVASKFGTPLYVYDSRIIADRLKRVTDTFPDFEILFSLKSNPNPSIAKVLAQLGASSEVGSIAELRVAIQAGFPPSKITYGGPSKQENELHEALKAQVGIIDVESIPELRTVERLGRRLQEKIPVTFRVNTTYHPAVAGELMAGAPSQFGIDEETLVDQIKAEDCRYADYQGVHAHIASQVLDVESWIFHYKNLAQMAKKFSSELGFDLKILNFGGGLGVPYARREQFFALKTLGRKARGALDLEFGHLRNKPRCQIELGRYLVAESGIFLTRILELKTSRGTDFVITESAISGLSRPAMPWAQQHPCSIVSKQNALPVGRYKVVGRSCLPSDVLSESVELPDPQPGDVLGVHNAGAYGLTMSLVLWASQTPPAEVLYQNGEFILARKRSPEILWN
jgi:diaminopimelate decarboxylase